MPGNKGEDPLRSCTTAAAKALLEYKEARARLHARAFRLKYICCNNSHKKRGVMYTVFCFGVRYTRMFPKCFLTSSS